MVVNAGQFSQRWREDFNHEDMVLDERAENILWATTRYQGKDVLYHKEVVELSEKKRKENVIEVYDNKRTYCRSVERNVRDDLV